MSTCRMEATASAACSSSGPCLARNLASSGMAASAHGKLGVSCLSGSAPQRTTERARVFSKMHDYGIRLAVPGNHESFFVLEHSPQYLFQVSARCGCGKNLRKHVRICELCYHHRFSLVNGKDNQLLIVTQNRAAQVFCAASTRGIPRRSLVTPTLAHVDSSSRGATAGKLSWPSSRTKMPAGLSSVAACATRSP